MAWSCKRTPHRQPHRIERPDDRRHELSFPSTSKKVISGFLQPHERPSEASWARKRRRKPLISEWYGRDGRVPSRLGRPLRAYNFLCRFREARSARSTRLIPVIIGHQAYLSRFTAPPPTSGGKPGGGNMLKSAGSCLTAVQNAIFLNKNRNLGRISKHVR